MSEQITQITHESKVLEQNFNLLKKNYELLKKEKETLEQESIFINTAMKSTKLEVEQALEKLNDFEITVKNSIQWFKENTNIENISDYEQIKEQLDKCVKSSSNCEIDLKCIYNVNRKNNIRYIDDESATGKADFLKDLRLILRQNGGDCEDFSILYKAEFNYLLNKCLRNYSRDNIYSIAIDPKTDDALKIDEDYMYIICGTFDPKKVIGGVEGHCLNALTKNSIKNSKSIYQQISHSVMVEPQIGEFYGNMNLTDHIKIFDDGMVPDRLYYIDFVITDDDLYIYDPYAENIEWSGYHNFLEKSAQIMESVEK